MLNIVLFVCENAYRTTEDFAANLAKAFKKQGCTVRMLRFHEGFEDQVLREIFNNPPDLTCSYSDITIGGIPIGEGWKIPHLSFLVDPFPYFLHQAKGKFSYVTTVDLADFSLLESLCPKKSFFFPHAAPSDLVTAAVSEKKLYDIVFFATAIDSEEVLQKSKNRKLLVEAANLVLSAQGFTCFDALVYFGISPHEPHFFSLFQELDLYIRGKDRLDLLRSLQGLRIAIFGSQYGEKGWKELLPSSSNLSIYPAISFDQSIEMMKLAKCVLNSHPRLKHGSHERVFYGMAAAALVVTGEGRFTQLHFKQNKELITYTYGDYSLLREMVQEFLNDPNKLNDITSMAREEVLKNHTYEKRVEKLLTHLAQK